MSAKHPAAFINTIAESGTKDEAVRELQKLWDEHVVLKAALQEILERDKTHYNNKTAEGEWAKIARRALGG